MKRKFIIGTVIIVLLFSLTGCDCEHEYDNGVVSKEPTCVVQGEKTYTCRLCKSTKIEYISTTKHSYSEIITIEPTEEKEGEKTFKCENCEEFYTEIIPMIEVEYEKGTRENPYDFDEIIYLECITDLYGYYSGGATLNFSNYNKNDYTFELDIELEDDGSTASIEPIGDYAIIVSYVSSEYVDLEFIEDSTDPSKMNLLSQQSLSLYAGGKGHTYMFPLDSSKINVIPTYITLWSSDSYGNESWVWVKLPD